MARTVFTRRPNSGLGNIRRGFTDPTRTIDWVLMGAVGALTIIGAFMIYSATRPRLLNRGADPFQFVQRQIIFVIIAIVVMAVVMWMDYVQLRGSAELFYAVTIVLLILLFVAGSVTGGARLSFDVGPIAIQPSEIGKVSTLLLLAGFLAEDDGATVRYERFIQSLFIVGVPVALVAIQPDLGSASVFVACAMGVLLVAGADIKYIILITSLAIVSVIAGVVSGVVKDYQLRRITGFLNQNSDSAALQTLVTQVRFAKRAVATGGFFGKGYLNGPLTNGAFIPVQSTDFVFSAVGEQFGMLGAGIVLALFGVVLWRIYRIARIAQDRLGFLLCAGVFTMILWQAFQNIGMTMGITPVSGVPLPFVSYGGSHTVAFAIMIGLVQSVHMRRFR
ncbi:MAG: rod shape-determining protein RodA [Ilumatobacteraceae bacterium]|jgi:rod shape determining protein RodA|nr:rod shape-determining protein RodA [Ilumatobacteraceae bacterium]